MVAPPEFVLITGPMVGTSSWAPTAERLRNQGARVEVPDAVDPSRRMPPWRDWTSKLFQQNPGGWYRDRFCRTEAFGLTRIGCLQEPGCAWHAPNGCANIATTISDA